MSLDVYLTKPRAPEDGCGIRIWQDEREREITIGEWDAAFPGAELTEGQFRRADCVYDRNITHNLGKMAVAAGIYGHLWRPDEIGVTTAGQLVGALDEGLRKLRSEPDTFKALNPPNGWGDYEGLISFVAEYVEACRANPDSLVRASR